MKMLKLILSVVVALLAHRASALAISCEGAFEGQSFPDQLTADFTEYALTFARNQKLPIRYEHVGDPKLGRKRFIIGLDSENEAHKQAYFDAFHIDSAYKSFSGILTVEAQFEVNDSQYVYVWVREKESPNLSIWRFGQRNNETFNSVVQSARATYLNYPPNETFKPVVIAHPIAITQAQKDNVLERYMAHPAWRAPLRNNNCVDFIPCVELGLTGPDVHVDQRQMISHHLGFSRTNSHDEIVRRFAHAANEKHQVIFLMVEGQQSLDQFMDVPVEKLLPPQPKKSYREITLNYDTLVAARAAVDPVAPVIPVNHLELAINKINDGDKIFFPIGAGASSDAFMQLIERAKTFEHGVDVYMLVNGIGEGLLRRAVQETDGKIRLHSLFLGQSMRGPYKDGLIQYHAGYLSDFSRFIVDPDKPEFKFDAIVVRVAEADAHGRYSLGPNNDHILTMIQWLRQRGLKVIAEVNPNVPRTVGVNFLTADQIDAKFPSDAPLPSPTRIRVTDVEAKVGEYLATLIPDYSVLQIGIGNIFDGLPVALSNIGRKELSIRTEMFSDALMEIMESGVAKTAITGFAYGTEKLYKWLDNNPNVDFWTTDAANNPGLIAAIPKFMAVNTALQVSLYGEVNATFGVDGRISSPGGQVEFMSGAAKSIGGKSIIALRSSAKNETISSITLDLYHGPVTTPHEMVSHVVTEYGVAHLRGKTERERAIALINIAHPKFRRNLFDEAIGRRLVSAHDLEKINL